jgi:hypothetical protein
VGSDNDSLSRHHPKPAVTKAGARKNNSTACPPDSSKFERDHPFQLLDEELLKPEKPE